MAGQAVRARPTSVTVTAIYEFEGPDTYGICFDPAGAAAPRAFAANRGAGHIRQTWKREKQWRRGDLGISAMIG